MPEITLKPPAEKVIEQSTPAAYLKAITRDSLIKKPSTYQEIQDRKGTMETRLKIANPGMSEETIDTICGLFFGPIMLPENMHRFGAENEAQKEMSARIQQNLVHVLFRATTEQASDRYLLHEYDYARTLQLLCESDFGKSYNLLRFWNGVKSQLAVIHALLDSNQYKVLIPNYAQDKTKTPERDNEILQWDVRSGVDLIALSKDGTTALLIDAKGRKNNPEVPGDNEDTFGERQDVSIDYRVLTGSEIEKLNSCVRRSIPKGVIEIARARIVIPTAAGYLGSFGLPAYPPDGYRQALKDFTSLKPGLAHGIIKGLEPEKVEAVA